MHLVRCRVVDQSRFQRRDVEQQVAPPILHLAQRAHLSRVIDDQIVHSSLGIRIAFVHLEVNQFAVLLGLGVQLEDFAHSFVQLLLDFRRPLEVAPVAVAHREPQELLVPVEMVSQVDGLDLVENARRLDVQPDQPGHRIRRLVEGGDLRVLLELQFPIGVLQHLLGTETDELKESHGLLIGNGDVLAFDLEDVLAQRCASLIVRQRRIDAAEHGELVDLRQKLERGDGCRFDQFGDVLVVLVRLLGHSMLLGLMLSGLPLFGTVSAVRHSRDDSQHDLGLDAGQPVLAVLQGQGVKIDATDARFAGEVFQRDHAVEPAQPIRCHQGRLVGSGHDDDVAGQELAGMQPREQVFFAVVQRHAAGLAGDQRGQFLASDGIPGGEARVQFSGGNRHMARIGGVAGQRFLDAFLDRFDGEVRGDSCPAP